MSLLEHVELRGDEAQTLHDDDVRIEVWVNGQLQMLTPDQAHHLFREQRSSEEQLARRPDEQAAGRTDYGRSHRTR